MTRTRLFNTVALSSDKSVQTMLNRHWRRLQGRRCVNNCSLISKSPRRLGFRMADARRVVRPVAELEAELHDADAAAGTLRPDETNITNRGTAARSTA